MSRLKWFCALGAALLVIGCGKEKTSRDETAVNSPSPKPTTTSTTVTAPAAVTQAQLDGITKAKQPYKILLLVKTLNNPFFQPMVAAFKQTATELGVQGEVEAAPQETDVDKQVDLVQTAVAQGYKAILITPADSKALVPALKAAADKGVLIVNVDNRLDKETVQAQKLDLGGYVGADNTAGGQLAGEALLEAMGGKGDVVIIEGIRGVDNAESRKRGFTTAVQGKLTIDDAQTGEWMTEKAQKVMQTLLAAHPDIGGVFCANDQMAIGAIKAIEAAGKKGQVKVVSYDNIAEVKPYLASGELVATIEQHPELMGKDSVKLAVGVLDGTVPKGGELLVQLETIRK